MSENIVGDLKVRLLDLIEHLGYEYIIDPIRVGG